MPCERLRGNPVRPVNPEIVSCSQRRRGRQLGTTALSGYSGICPVTTAVSRSRRRSPNLTEVRYDAYMSDKIVVITGASAGIGAAVAERLAREQMSVVLVARRREALEAVAARCGGHARVVVGDVTRRDDVRRAVDDALAAFGRIDVCINNAGQGISRNPSELTDEDLDAVMRANVY